MVRIYGLKSCDTCRKALKALTEAGRSPDFVDLRATPVEEERLVRWLDLFGAEALINRRSTTWRGLGEAERKGPPLDLMRAHPTLIKRPVIEDGETVTLGWDAQARALHLG